MLHLHSTIISFWFICWANSIILIDTDNYISKYIFKVAFNDLTIIFTNESVFVSLLSFILIQFLRQLNSFTETKTIMNWLAYMCLLAIFLLKSANSLFENFLSASRLCYEIFISFKNFNGHSWNSWLNIFFLYYLLAYLYDLYLFLIIFNSTSSFFFFITIDIFFNSLVNESSENV